jgi:hypothetical protein
MSNEEESIDPHTPVFEGPNPEASSEDQKRFEELTWPAYKGIVDSVEGFFKMITDEQVKEIDELLDRLGTTHFQLNWKGRTAEELEHRGLKITREIKNLDNVKKLDFLN